MRNVRTSRAVQHDTAHAASALASKLSSGCNRELIPDAGPVQRWEVALGVSAFFGCSGQFVNRIGRHCAETRPYAEHRACNINFRYIPTDRVWMATKHAIVFTADIPVAEGGSQKPHFERSCPVDRRAEGRVGLGIRGTRSAANRAVPDGGFSIGLMDGLTMTMPVPHTVMHVSRRAGDTVALPECREWIHDDGLPA